MSIVEMVNRFFDRNRMKIVLTDAKIVAGQGRRVDQEIKNIRGEVLERIPSKQYYYVTISKCDGVFEERTEYVASDIHIEGVPAV